MRIPLFDRRDRRLVKVARLVDGQDDQALKSYLERCSPGELAFTLGRISLDRANIVLAGLSQARIEAALELVTSYKPGEEPEVERPTSVRMLDFAGKVFGFEKE